MRSLDEYRRKRNFKLTSEPAGPAADAKAKALGEKNTLKRKEKGGDFVIQKHDASHLHYDLRLEIDGVYKSWAVPKGPSLEPGKKRLAVKTEDHPLEYGDFEGTIPAKEYGGGTVMIWDRGQWHYTDKTKKKDFPKRIDFALNGEKLQGAWTLVKTAGKPNSKAEHWLLIKRTDKGAELSKITDLSVKTGRTMEQIAAGEDAATDTDQTSDTQPKFDKETDETTNEKGKSNEGRRKAEGLTQADIKSIEGAQKKKVAANLSPMLARLADDAPQGEDWLHEIKFDGYRILAHKKKDTIKLLSRNGKDWTKKFPQIAKALKKLNIEEAVLDGEVVAMDDDGTSSFRALQAALSAEKTSALLYQAFDLIYLNERDLTATPLTERKYLLAKLLEEFLQNQSETISKRVRYTDHIVGRGPEFFQQACQLGLEGIISKQADSTYRLGQRKNWLKVKCTAQDELIVCGYTKPKGQRKGFGALLLGAWQGDELIYTGKVGTGFSHSVLKDVFNQLQRLERKTSPFANPPEEPQVHWVTPQLVAEVEFTEWTRDGVLRHPSFRGLREDKEAKDIKLPDVLNSGKSKASKTADTEKSQASSKVSTHKLSKSTAKPSKQNGRVEIEGVSLSSPDKVLYAEQGITKLQLAQYYQKVEPWVLRQLVGRPLSLVRCPEGFDKECFFQKHPGSTLAKSIPRVQVKEKNKNTTYVYVEELSHIIALVQMGVLELHAWGSKADDLEHPDMMVFDLDPGPDVKLETIFSVAKDLKERLSQLGLESFPRTTGGKGLHLVIPIQPHHDWDQVKAFCRGVAHEHAQDDSDRVTANMAKSKRKGKIYLDYLRNGRGATAIASYSPRARPGAPVAVPVAWRELTAALKPDRYNVENIHRRLAVLQQDPWADFEQARRKLTSTMFKKVKVEGD